MRSTRAHDAVGLVADQLGQLALAVGHRLLEQLRRAADAGQRVLDLVRQHRRQRGDRAGGAAVGQLAVDLVGDRLLVSDTATRPSLSTIGDRRSAQKRLPMRGELKVTPFSATAPPLASTCSSSEKSGVSSGTNSLSGWPTRRARPTPKNCSAAEVGVADHGRRRRPRRPASDSDRGSRVGKLLARGSSARFRGRTAMLRPPAGRAAGRKKRGEQRAHLWRARSRG